MIRYPYRISLSGVLRNGPMWHRKIEIFCFMFYLRWLSVCKNGTLFGRMIRLGIASSVCPKITLKKLGLNLTWPTLHFVGWVEHPVGFVGFLRLRRTNLHFISSIAQCETQQRPILKPSPKN